MIATKFFFHRQQPDFTNLAPRRKKRVELFELLVQREGPTAADRQHPCHLAAAERDQVRIFGMEFVHQSLLR
jgi:hypothetical protein